MPSHPATRRQSQAWTVVLASLGVFMTALDTLVVTTALPVMRVDLGGSLADLEWTVNAYNLAFACALLTGAALGGRSLRPPADVHRRPRALHRRVGGGRPVAR